jgi:toxin ParE1/3/4
LSGQRWRVRLSEPAERDFLAILDWTVEHFGWRQARVYRRTLIAAIAALHDGPDAPGNLARDDIQAGLRSLHVARQGRRGRHFILYRASSATTIEVIRILDDAMDFPRNLPSNP